MSPIAIRLLQFHKSNPQRASFPLQEMAMNNVTLMQMDAAYKELIERNFVMESGRFASVTPRVRRPTYKITKTGMDALPIVQSPL